MGTFMQIQFMVLLWLSKTNPSIASATINSVACTFDPKACNPSYCFSYKGKGEATYIDASCSFKKPVDVVWIQSEIMKRNTNKKYETFFKPEKRNLCDFAKWTSNNFLVGRLMSINSKYIKVMNCPLKDNLTLSKMPLMLHLLQGILSQGDYISKTKLFSDDIPIFYANISFSITSTQLGGRSARG